MSEKTKGQLLSEKLMYKKLNAYEKYPNEADSITSYCEGYKKYLDAGKTAREAAEEAVRLAKLNGFEEFTFGKDVKAGGKYYYIDRKSVV